jgi:hypothetical protein
MDIASIGGIALAILGILVGMMIEGGSIPQPTAAMIIFDGTLGAVMLQFPMNIFLARAQSNRAGFVEQGAPSLNVGFTNPDTRGCANPIDPCRELSTHSGCPGHVGPRVFSLGPICLGALG